jgi:subtilase family serine protease
MRILKFLSPILLLASSLSTLTYAVTPDRISGAINGGPTVTLKGSIHRKALPKYDQGPADRSLRLGYMTLLTRPTPSQVTALKQLVAEQQDRNSPQYHKWITPEQWADRFGLSHGDIQKLTAWLKSQGFTVLNVARGRNWIAFSGSAAQVQSAFATEIHRYNVDGEMHVANANAPKIPVALSGVVSALRGLDDFHPKPRAVKNARAARPDYYANIFQPPSPPDFFAPGDLATIYDMNALYTAGVDGTGQKLAVIGQTDVFLADINDFRNGFGLTPISGCTNNSSTGTISACNTSNFQYLVPTGLTDSGTPSLGDLTEADLDIEWSGAVARNAQIIYVNAPFSDVNGGVTAAWYFAIDNQIAPVISLSYGICEFGDNFVLDSSGQPASDELELMKANTEGITFLNSTGDSGAAGCDASQNSSTQNLAVGGLAVGYPASSPEVTGVGGTAIAWPAGYDSTYWGTTNAADGGSALAYTPETSWNDDEELALIYSNVYNTALEWQQNYAIVSGGGGPSNCAQQTSDFTNCVAGFTQPAWQTVTIPSQSSVRFSPDVALNGSPNFPGYIFCTPENAWNGSTNTASTCASGIPAALTLTDDSGNSTPSLVGGTSASTPVMAGIVTLLNQYLAGPSSPGLGNINPTLYSLAATPSNGAFHQVTTGDNTVYCVVGQPVAPWPAAMQCPAAGVFGYQASNADATTGYNLVTGLGSVDADKLAIAWAATRAASSVTLTPSSTQVYQNSSVTLTAAVTPSTAIGNVTFNNGTAVLGTVAISAGAAALTTSTLPVAANVITASFNGNGALANSTSTAATVTVSSAFTLAPTAPSFTVTQGAPASPTINVTLNGGFNGTLAFTCTDPAPESLCTPPPNTNASGQVSFMITTTAPTVGARQPSAHGMRIFCAMLLPGLLGIVFTAGSRRRSIGGMRLLGLIVLLGFSTLWLGSCGGSSNNNNSSSNQGTPAGSYTITVNATSGSATGTPVTFQLVVQ